jgi:acyl carrier protein
MADVTCETIAADLEAFIKKRFHIPDHDPDFTRDVNLWDAGFVDSSGVVEMIAHLERTFSTAIPDSVLFSPEFSTVNGIALLIKRLLTGTTEQPAPASLFRESRGYSNS